MKGEIFGLPADCILGIPSIRTIGDTAIEIMNYGGLHACSPSQIVLNTKIGELIVGGETLGIAEINSDGIRIEGKINRIIYG